uniref:THAP domain containing 4 n=1 Tax=Leptobrachium leishanense TaxID=445787 RepID=A0A8C5MJG0_9ANUR
MVICCSAPNCTNRQGKGCRGRVSFHRFPLKDPARLALWAASLQRNNWSPGPYSFLCSNHFSPDSFVLRMHDQIPLLKPTAVPSIFPDGKANRTADRGRPHGGGKTFAKKKLLPKRSLPPSCGGDLNNERSNQHNIVVNDDLEDLSSVFIHSFSPNIPSARKFISSLHSYSRPSLPPALQNVKPVGHMDDMRSTGHACTDPTSSENMTFYADVSDTFPSDAPQSVNRVQTDSETSSHSASVVPSTLHKAMSPSASGQQPYLSTGLKDGVNTLDCDQLTPHAITSLHSYCFPSKPQPGHQNQLKKKTGTDRRWYCDTPVCNTRDLPSLNPAVAPLAWMLGSWVSEQDGQGEFPTISSFQYKEEAVISHVGQPMLNFTTNKDDILTRTVLGRTLTGLQSAILHSALAALIEVDRRTSDLSNLKVK